MHLYIFFNGFLTGELLWHPVWPHRTCQIILPDSIIDAIGIHLVAAAYSSMFRSTILCGQQLYVQVEASKKWSPSGVCLGISSIL